jgi:hypothetical protein
MLNGPLYELASIVAKCLHPDSMPVPHHVLAVRDVSAGVSQASVGSATDPAHVYVGAIVSASPAAFNSYLDLDRQNTGLVNLARPTTDYAIFTYCGRVDPFQFVGYRISLNS